MHYRTLGRTGKWLSFLSFGCMRYHTDEEEAVRAIRTAIELGVNYFETSIGYGGGESEVILGRGVQGLRGSVFLSTKSSPSDNPKADDVRKTVDRQLGKLGTDHLEFYQLWSINWSDYQKAAKRGAMLDGLRQLQREKVIDHVGFTSHDSPENIVRMVKTGEFESVTVVYNATSRKNEPVLEAAERQGIGVVIMQPLAGGVIAQRVDTLKFLQTDVLNTPALGALRFLACHREITTVPSGMKTVAEVEENVRIADYAASIDEDERLELHARLSALDLKGDYCTGCGYCLPCPQEVDIPGLLGALNIHKVIGDTEAARRRYRNPALNPDKCVQCLECEAKCPEKLPVTRLLEEAGRLLGL